ncbi:MAG: TIGR01244 family phosphatase [Piscinibacter sp.]|nr:TIGR01244 family phosphatase [Piscinibacter sp.]
MSGEVHIQRVSPDVCVAGQLGPESMAAVAAHGFRSVINNRPDFEAGPMQPTSADIETAARAAGLAYAFLPVAPAVQSAAEIARMAELVAALPKPILAFCRTGARSGRLYIAGTQA